MKNNENRDFITHNKNLEDIQMTQKSKLLKAIVVALFVCLFSNLMITAQVNTGGSSNTSNHTKQIIGYITQWDAWKAANAGLPAQGALTHLNIDYSKYTILNFSFFGVAKDGSLHSGDFRNKNIYQSGAVQEPADIFYTDIYSSWDLYILFGEIDPIQYISKDVVTRATAQGFSVVENGTTWSHPTWGLYNKPLPLPLHKEGGAPGILELAHSKGVKVMASIGGWSMCKHYPEMAADPAKRAKFITDCKKLIAIGFDGIDLDWEYPGPYAGMNFTGTQADFTNFTTLIQEIRTAIGPSKLITAAMSADPAKLQGFEWSKLVQTMNYFNMMTYDFNGGWSNKAGHNSPLYTYDNAEAPTFNWKSTLDKLVSLGVPKTMINMGTPFYGRGVICNGNAGLNVATVKQNLTVQPDGPISTCADFTNWPQEVYDGTPNYFFIKQKALGAGSGWVRQWDNQAKVPYLTNGKYFLSYDDEESIGLKAQFIIDNQLAGSIVWTVYGDLEIGGTATDFGTKLKRWSDVKSVLVNKLNEVFASGPQQHAPTVSITSPANGATFNSNPTITINATASDVDGNLSKVEFFQGTQSLGVDNSSPYSVTWSGMADGSYTLTAVATDNTNLTGRSSEVKITIGTVPLVASAGGPYSGKKGIAVTFNGSATGGKTPYTYSWNFGDGSTGTGNAPTHAYASAGTFTASLTVTDASAKTASSSATVTITDEGNCSNYPAYPAGRGTYVGGTKVSNINNIYECKPWPYDGWANSTSPAYVPGVGSNWQDAWIYIGPCSGTVKYPPTVSITSPANNATFTAGSNITVSATASDQDGTVSKVDFYQGTTSIGTDNSSPYSITWNSVAAGTYQLKAIATDNDNQSTTSAIITIVVNGVQPLTAKAGGPYSAQTNQSVSFNGSATGGTSPYSYSWNFGDGTTGTGATPAHSYTTAGTYTATLTVKDATNATANSSATVTITATPALALTVSIPTSGTISQSVCFTATASGGTTPYSYSWNFGDGSTGTGANVCHTYTTAASYTVTCTVTDAVSSKVTKSGALTITGGNNCTGLPAYPAGLGTYVGGTRVSNGGNIYECKPWPYSLWANMGGAYAPGVGFAWQDAWTLIGPCTAAKAALISEPLTQETRNDIWAFPNPAENEVFISLRQAESMNYKVYNISGQLVLKGTISGNFGKINISAINNGIYLINVNGTQYTRIVKR